MLRLRFSSFTSGNDQDVTNEMTANWRETTLPTMLFYYNPRNIYNSDKFSLFYRVLSTKVMHLEDKKSSGGSNSNIQLTRSTTANMCG